jgi:hypothetical protein
MEEWEGYGKTLILMSEYPIFWVFTIWNID